jgi:hypothetical protein
MSQSVIDHHGQRHAKFAKRSAMQVVGELRESYPKEDKEQIFKRLKKHLAYDEEESKRFHFMHCWDAWERDKRRAESKGARGDQRGESEGGSRASDGGSGAQYANGRSSAANGKGGDVISVFPSKEEREKTSREEQEKIAQKVSDTILRVIQKVHVLTLDFIMPNGKRLRDCTGTEVMHYGNCFCAIGRKAGKRLIGDVFKTNEELLKAA